MELSKRSRVRVQHVEFWLGHVTSLFKLRPCLLSIFDKIYRFSRIEVSTRVPLWPSVRREIRQACSVLWLARVELGCEIIQQVDAGDSADHGYAMMTAGFSDREILQVLQYREKWRFIPLPQDVNEALTKQDVDQLIRLLESRAGVPIQHPGSDDEVQSSASLGIDTAYGQWLQQALVEGD